MNGQFIKQSPEKLIADYSEMAGLGWDGDVIRVLLSRAVKEFVDPVQFELLIAKTAMLDLAKIVHEDR